MNDKASVEPRSADPGVPALSGWRYRAVFYSVALAALGYLAFSLWVGWRDVWSAAWRVRVTGLASALGLSLVNYWLRFVRWQLYLRTMGHPVPWGVSLRIYLAGFALTTTPGKAGEMLRSVLLKPHAVPYPASFAAFFSERLSDLLAVVLLALVGLSAYPPARPLVAAAGLLAAAGFLVLTSAALARKVAGMVTGPSKFDRTARHALEILEQARRCHAPVPLVTATVLGLVAWAAEAWAFHLVLSWMGVEVSLTFAVFVYAASMLAGALTFMPGGLGGAEAVMAGLLLWRGVGHADAVAATVLIRLTTLWFAVGLGGAALIARDQDPKQRWAAL